jgi:hypothetical protein
LSIFEAFSSMRGSFAASGRQRLHGLNPAFWAPLWEKKNLVFSSSGFLLGH